MTLKAFESIFDGENFEQFPLYDPSDCKSTVVCMKIEIILRVLYTMAIGFHEGLGTLLRNFIDLSPFDSFSTRKKLFNIHFDKVIFGNMENFCQHLKQEEIKLHEIFVNVSTIMGFSTSEAMSLYEIPAMLADPSSDNGKDELRHGSMPKSFYYSRCKYGSKYEDLEMCETVWHDYVENLFNRTNTGT